MQKMHLSETTCRIYKGHLSELEVMFPLSSYGTSKPRLLWELHTTGGRMCTRVYCNCSGIQQHRHTSSNTRTRCFRRTTTVAKSSCEAHKQSQPTPPLIKADHNIEAPQLTSLRHNKQCFDMVLNIPFPPTHTNTGLYCVIPSRRHVMERCQLATCPTQTIGRTFYQRVPTKGYYRASRGGYSSSGGDWQEVTVVQSAGEQSITHFGASLKSCLGLSVWCCEMTVCLLMLLILSLT